MKHSIILYYLGLYIFLNICFHVNGLGEVLYAINAGGETHIDVYGIRYERDPLHDKIGTASDFGKQLIIGRVSPGDQILYQTERYHHSTFGYDIPIKGNGEYVIVLKFCEVYFNAPEQKVFDVVLNEELKVVSNLDIYEEVGRGVGHDEYVSFSIEDDVINWEDTTSSFTGNKIRIDFVKGYKDNPKINAVYVIKGRIEDVPKLAMLPRDEEMESGQEDDLKLEQKGPTSAKRKPSGPRTRDPYADDESSSLLPVFVAIGAAVPLLFCLCKL